jgi:gamma-glutamylcyclotransferase
MRKLPRFLLPLLLAGIIVGGLIQVGKRPCQECLQDRKDTSMSGDCWYFAYGSNLLKKQMQNRVGEMREPQVCRLADYRFAFNKRKGNGPIYANIVKQPGSTVWGVIYRCSEQAMRKLDQYEGIGHYHRQPVDVVDCSGATIRAVAYVANDDCICPDGKPSDEYLHRIITGAKEHGLPADYVAAIVAKTKS